MSRRLVVEDLTHRFEKARRLLEGVSFVAEPGEILGVHGPNGSGKSTLIRILATLIEPQKGVIRFGDHHYERPSAELRGLIGYGPGPLGSFYANLTGRQNLEFFHRLKRPDFSFPFGECHRLAEVFQLDKDLDKMLRTYSTGMKQRLGLIRTWLAKPDLLLLDEPVSSLDLTGEERFYGLLKELQAERKAVIVVASPKPAMNALETQTIELGSS